MRRGVPAMVALALLAVLAAACGGSEAVGPSATDAPSADAPPRDAELVDADWPQLAAWIRRENAEGRPVIVNFFASWCGPCREEAPVLRAAAALDGVALIGVAYRDREEDAAGFLEEEQLGIPTLLDFDGSIGADVGVRGMPTTVFFDREGRMVDSFTGILTEELLAERLADLGVDAAAAAG